MIKYIVAISSDETDCETCGGSWATGYSLVEKETGNTLIELEPVASCFGGNDFEIGDLIKRIQIEFPDIKFSEVDFDDNLYSHYENGVPYESC